MGLTSVAVGTLTLGAASPAHAQYYYPYGYPYYGYPYYSGYYPYYGYGYGWPIGFGSVGAGVGTVVGMEAGTVVVMAVAGTTKWS